MAELRVRSELPAKVGLPSLPEIGGRERLGSRESILTKSVVELYKTLKDQVEVRAWAFSLPPTGKAVLEKLGAYTNVLLTAHWKKDAPTVIYGVGEAFVPSSYPIAPDIRKKAELIKSDRTAIAKLVREAVANDAKAAFIERFGGKRFDATAQKLHLKADTTYAQAKALELGLAMDIQSLPHTERVPMEKARLFYRSLDVELEDAVKDAQKHNREFGSQDVNFIIEKLRRELGITPKAQRLEATADTTPKKKTITVSRGTPTVVAEAQAQASDKQVATSRSVRTASLLLLASELTGLAYGNLACNPRVPIETPPPGGTEIPLLPPSVDKITADSAAKALAAWNGKSLGDSVTMKDTGVAGFGDQELLFPSQEAPAQLAIRDTASGKDFGKATLVLVASGRPDAFDSFLVVNNVAYHLESFSVNSQAGTTNAALVDSEGNTLGTLAVNTALSGVHDGVWGTILLGTKEKLGAGTTQQTVNLVFTGNPTEQRTFFETLASRPIRALKEPLVTPTAPSPETPTPVNLNVSPEVKAALTQEKALNPDGSVKTTLVHSEGQTNVEMTEYAVTPTTDTSATEIITGKDAAGQRYIWNEELSAWTPEFSTSMDYTHPETAPVVPMDAFYDGSVTLSDKLYFAEHPDLISPDASHPYYKVNVSWQPADGTIYYDISITRDGAAGFTDPEETQISYKISKPFAYFGLRQTEDKAGNVIYVINKANGNPDGAQENQIVSTHHGFDKATYEKFIGEYGLIFTYLTNEKNMPGELAPVFPPPPGTYGFNPFTFNYGLQLTNPSVAGVQQPSIVDIFPEKQQIIAIFEAIKSGNQPVAGPENPNSVALKSLPPELSRMILYTGLRGWQ